MLLWYCKRKGDFMKRKYISMNILLLTGLLFSSGIKTHTKTSAVSARAINISNTTTQNVRSYYSALNSKQEHELKGEALLTSLKPILSSGHQTISYSDVWDWSMVTDRDWDLSPMTQAQINNYNFSDNPYVKLLYRSDNGTATAPRINDSHGTVIDREHVWPKSLGDFGENAPAGTDLHHLILADSKNNQDGHSNYPYGNVNPSSYTPIDSYYHKDNPSNVGNYTGKRGEITFNGRTYTVYEPQDEDKGDIARAMFYMAARYSGYTTSSDPYLKLSNTPHTTTFPSTSSSPGQAGLLSTLLEWHEQDSVSDYEIRRNNLIFNNVQYNRNPFIDYPSWVDAIWGNGAAANPATDTVTQFGASLTTAPQAITLTPSPLTMYKGDTSKLYVTVSPTNTSKSVTWTSSNTSIVTVNNEGIVTAYQNEGTTTITARSTKNSSVTATVTVTVSDPSLANEVKGTFDSTEVVTTQNYRAYDTDDWLITFGGNHVSGGTNSTQRGNANLSSYTKYTYGKDITTSHTAFAVANIEPFSDVSKITFKMNGGSNHTRALIYLLKSTDNNIFNQIDLAETGTNKQGVSAQDATLMEFEFDAIPTPTYFAVVFRDSGSSGNFRLDNIELNFIAGVSDPVELEQITVSGTPTTQYVGEVFNPEGLTFTGHYSDQTTKPLDASEFTFGPSIMDSDTDEVTAMYDGVSAIISGVTVTERPQVSECSIQFVGTHSNTALTLAKLNNETKIGAAKDMFEFIATERVYVDNTKTTDNYGDLNAIKLSTANDSGSFTLKLKDGKGYEITKVTLSVRRWFNDSPTIKVNNLANQNVTGDVYKDYTFNPSTPYTNIFTVTATKRVYINNITVEFIDPASNFNAFVMGPADYDGTTPECLSNFNSAITMWNALNSDAKAYFTSDAKFSDARARLENWSRANNSNFFLNPGSYGAPNTINDSTTNDSAVTVTLLIALLGLTTLAGYYFLSKKEKTK